MWSPTHVKVTVQRCKDLLIKGKNGTNDAFVTIALGKEKFQTSIKEKSCSDVEWREECELQIPKKGNTAEILLTVLHHNFLGVDEFLGMVNIPLAEFDIYERPKNRWYQLHGKPGKEKKDKRRGELEVRVIFTVKSGSLSDLSKKEKHKSSLGQLSHVAHSIGGSLLSISSLEKKKGLRKIAKSLGNKVKINKKNPIEDPFEESLTGKYKIPRQSKGDADPGVVSDDDDFTFDELSHKSSNSSLYTTQTTTTPGCGSLENLAGGEFLRRNNNVPGTPIVSSKSNKALTSSIEKIDEWEQKLNGKHGKESYSGNTDNFKRRSLERTILKSQPEEPEDNNSARIICDRSDSASSLSLNSPNLSQTSVTKTQLSSGPPKFFKDTCDISRLKAHDQDLREHKPEKEANFSEFSKFSRKFKNFRKDLKINEITSAQPNLVITEERIIIGRENDSSSKRYSSEILQKFEGKSREELIEMICKMEESVDQQSRRLKDLEEYLDNLLLRVMETTPKILQNPYVFCKTQANLIR